MNMKNYCMEKQISPPVLEILYGLCHYNVFFSPPVLFRNTLSFGGIADRKLGFFLYFSTNQHIWRHFSNFEIF